MGISIGKVFKPIEKYIGEKINTGSYYMPCFGYGLKSLFINIYKTCRFVFKDKSDIVHITGSEHYLLPFLKILGVKTIVTVHDLGFYTNHRDKKLKAWWKKLLWINTLKYSDQIICISEKTKKEVMSLVHDNVPIRVINDPVGSDFIYSPKDFNHNKPTILQIGTKSNKNIERVIEALSAINCKLVIIGPLNDNHRELLVKYNIDFENRVGITDGDLLEEYKKCDIVSLPSLYEGFGVPILEGQAIGRVVVTSDVSPMKEVAGGGAVLANPEIVKSLHKAYLKAIDEHETLVQIGLENVKKYSVENVADQYLNIYNDVTF